MKEIVLINVELFRFGSTNSRKLNIRIIQANGSNVDKFKVN